MGEVRYSGPRLSLNVTRAAKLSARTLPLPQILRPLKHTILYDCHRNSSQKLCSFQRNKQYGFMNCMCPFGECENSRVLRRLLNLTSELWPNQPASHWVPRPLSVTKRMKCRGDFWPPSIAEEKPDNAVGTVTSQWEDDRRTGFLIRGKAKGFFPQPK